jgi:hypothetical protein
MRAAAFTLPLLLTGCVGEILDAPFVLASGLGAARGVAPSPRTTLLVATASGVVEVEGDGQAAPLVPGVDARAVATHRDRLYVLVEEGVLHGPVPGPGAPPALDTWARPGVVDLQASCAGAVLFADAEGVGRWTPETGAVARHGPALPGIQALSLDPVSACEGVLALTDDAVHWVSPVATWPVATGLDRPRALTADGWGGIWVVQGEPPVLAKLTTAGPEVRARHLAPTADLGFGVGELFHPANAYFVGPEGSLDYARVVPEGERIQAPRTPGAPPVLSAPAARP